MNIKQEAASVLGGAEEAIHSIPEVAENVQKDLRNWKENATAFVRDNPGVALLGAFVIGFAIAKAGRHV